MKKTRKPFVICKKKVSLKQQTICKIKWIQNFMQTKDPLSNKHSDQDLRLYPCDNDQKEKTCKMKRKTFNHWKPIKCKLYTHKSIKHWYQKFILGIWGKTRWKNKKYRMQKFSYKRLLKYINDFNSSSTKSNQRYKDERKM